MYIQLTKDVLDQLLKNWNKYYNARIDALTMVCQDALDGYYDACRGGLLLTEEEKQYYGDYDPTDDWLNRKSREINYWHSQMIDELKDETERFKEFIEELRELKFYDNQVGLICVVDFGKLQYEFIKNDDPKTSKLFLVRFINTYHWYSWDGKYKRTVKYETVDPDFTKWTND